MTLLESLSQVPDFRHPRGRRHELSLVLACILLGTLSGAQTWRDFRDFVERHRDALLEHLRPQKERLPSYSTLRRVLLGLNYQTLQDAFLLWARSRIQVEEGEWWAIDGKSLGGVSAQERFSPEQNFKAVLSLYAHKRGIVLESRVYENGHQSEAHLVRAMLQDMQAELAGAGLTGDALHCSKKNV